MKKGVGLKVQESFMVRGNGGEAVFCIDPVNAYNIELAKELKKLSEVNVGSGGKAIEFRTPEEAKLIV